MPCENCGEVAKVRKVDLCERCIGENLEKYRSEHACRVCGVWPAFQWVSGLPGLFCENHYEEAKAFVDEKFEEYLAERKSSVGKPRFKRDSWVRFRGGGRLAKVIGIQCTADGTAYNVLTPRRTWLDVPEENLEPATPWPGEWWALASCKTHVPVNHAVGEAHKGKDWDVRSESVQRRLECGCLVPVNFGLGEEGQR